MTGTSASVLSSPRQSPLAGQLCLWMGLLGAISGLVLAAVPPSVSPDRYSYPLDAGAWRAAQLWFGVQHLGLLAGLLALGRSGAAGSGRLASSGHLLSVGGLGLLTLTEFAAIGAATAPTTGAWADAMNTLYGVSTLGTGLGLLLLGTAVVRAGRWSGWARWLPLALGVWVFVPLTPALVLSFLGARLAISGWMLLFAAGAGVPRPPSPPPSRSARAG